MKNIRIVAISDTHNRYNNLIIPKCDIIISIGDYSFQGKDWEVKKFHEWLNKQDAEHIISVQGNHELGVEENWNESKQVALEACPKVHFIDEGSLEIEGIKIWCSAITPYFGGWAWNRHRGEDIQRHWDKIPSDTNILCTHGPPYGILDQAYTDGNNLGCYQLLWKVKKINPKYHLFGHIHGSHGNKKVGDTKFYNVSICDEQYMPSNPVTVIDYIKE